MHQVPRGPAKRTRTFAQCPLFPLYFCFVSRDVLQRESRPHGPPFISFYWMPLFLPPPLLNPFFLLAGLGSLYPCSVIYPFYKLFLGARFSSCLQSGAHRKGG